MTLPPLFLAPALKTSFQLGLFPHFLTLQTTSAIRKAHPRGGNGKKEKRKVIIVNGGYNGDDLSLISNFGA